MLNYTTYVAEIANLAVYQTGAAEFVGIIPGMIDFAEQRIYRELDLLSTNFTDYSTTLTAGTRTAALNNNFVVVDMINVISPSTADQNTGTRLPLTGASREVVDTLWPSAAVTGPPQLWAQTDQWDIILGPTPDASYLLEVRGTQRPAPLSASNPNTFLTDRLPDLFIAASMVFVGAWKMNFGGAINYGGAANAPGQEGSWEAIYQALLKSATTEELRKYKWAGSWSSYPVSPEAQPQRG